jgi:hypothetical protein
MPRAPTPSPHLPAPPSATAARRSRRNVCQSPPEECHRVWKGSSSDPAPDWGPRMPRVGLKTLSRGNLRRRPSKGRQTEKGVEGTETGESLDAPLRRSTWAAAAHSRSAAETPRCVCNPPPPLLSVCPPPCLSVTLLRILNVQLYLCTLCA